MNKLDYIHKGDCLDIMETIQSDSIDMIYLDPPFFTDKQHKLKNRTRTSEFSFDDIWASDREYAEFLHIRMLRMRDILKDSGCIFVHCDKSGEHIVRALLDRIFGVDNFQSEIIWYYKRWSNSKKGLLPAHQNIYFYSKTKNFKFNTIFTSYSESTNVDQILQDRTRDLHNKSIYKLGMDGKTVVAGEKKGVPLGDVWDIPYLNPKAKERVGYPTQKPILLIERIIEISSDEGDIILDPFCGSGTTCVAAKMMNRSFIGIDVSEEAVNLSTQRLKSPVKTNSNLLKNGRSSYLTADQNALKLLEGLEFNPVQRNKGIDAILVKQYQGAPILVKVQKKSESLHESANYLLKAMKKKQSLKAFLIRTHNIEMFDIATELEGVTIIDSPSVTVSKSFQT